MGPFSVTLLPSGHSRTLAQLMAFSHLSFVAALLCAFHVPSYQPLVTPSVLTPGMSGTISSKTAPPHLLPAPAHGPQVINFPPIFSFWKISSFKIGTINTHKPFIYIHQLLTFCHTCVPVPPHLLLPNHLRVNCRH